MAAVGVGSCPGTAARTPRAGSCPSHILSVPWLCKRRKLLDSSHNESQLPGLDRHKRTGVHGCPAGKQQLKSSPEMPTYQCSQGEWGGGSRKCPLRIHDLQLQ